MKTLQTNPGGNWFSNVIKGRSIIPMGQGSVQVHTDPGSFCVNTRQFLIFKNKRPDILAFGAGHGFRSPEKQFFY